MGVILILAGGVGERFWPVSTESRPKQFVPLTGRSPIVKETVDRVKELVGLEKVFVVTTKAQLQLMREVLSELPDDRIIVEPEGRNTAPGLVLGIARIKEKFGINEAVAVLPSDHFVGDAQRFRQILNRAFQMAAKQHDILTIGIKPVRPETEYGYILVGDELEQGVRKGLRFVEKPNFSKAQDYVNKGTYLWNSGIFVFQIKVLTKLIKEHSPLLHETFLNLQKAKKYVEIEAIYRQVPKVSFDYELMEKLPSFLVIPSEYVWDDLGSWRSLETVYQKDEGANIVVGDCELVDVNNCVLYSEKKPIAAIGVRDLVIAVSKEGTLICPKDRLGDIRSVVERIKRNQVPSNIFREYDIRGLVETELTPKVVLKLGRAFGRFMQNKGCGRALIGGDIRLSTPLIRQNLIRGLTSVGITVIDIGTVTTPLFYFGLHQLDVDGGVMITGSHNPKEFNGLKMAIGKSTIYGSDIQVLRKMTEEDSCVLSGENSTGNKNPAKVTQQNISVDYLNMLTDKIKLGPRKLKAVVDAGNGAASLFIEKFLRRLGVEVVPLFCEADGNFPNHHPDPVKTENLSHLVELVPKHKADLGIAYDGDADRLGVVDDRGQIIWGDKLMILFWREILAKHPGETALVEVKCSQALVEEIERIGGKPCFYKTGHSLIKAKMKEIKALFAGEMSGHMFFADEYYGFDDAFYATARLLRIISYTDKKLSELVSDVPVYFSTAETRIDCPDDQKFEVVEKIREEALKDYTAITIDGVRIAYPEGWGLVRASNTQAILVARCEAKTKEGLEFISSDLKERILRAGVGDFSWAE